ncbi:MAG: HAD family hydrolase [Candidatus Xenobiia bacterium LiM19]
MEIKGILFDINGTLTDIKTDEGNEEIYRAIAHVLTYQGISLHRGEVKDLYFKIMRRQREERGEEHPEFDAVAIFREILDSNSSDFTAGLPEAKREYLPLFLAELYRGVSRERLRIYPDVKEVLDEMQHRYILGIVTDAQSAYAIPELQAVGIAEYFDTIVVSGDFGYRKPDPRLYRTALENLELVPEHTVFVGNDMYHDVYGAQQVGMKAVLFMTEYGDKEREGVKADYVIRRFSELPKAIRFLEGL